MAVDPCSLIPSLRNIEIQSATSLANFTTLRIGGAAEWLAEPKSIDQLKSLINWAFAQKISCRIIGAGSNLLINDLGVEGLSLCTRKLHGIEIKPDSGLVEAAAGEPLPSLSRRAAKAGLHGLEWAVGIPGTVGGAVVMNAGAQGSCVAEWLHSVKVIPLNGKEPFELSTKELAYAYRYSCLQEEPLIVLSARFKLEPGHSCRKLSQITNENLLHRTNTQPYDLPSCGSIFRNPEPLKAARLIDDLGLKGHRIGGAEVSKTHANFIVNKSQASSSDINELITFIQQEVERAHGIKLIREVKSLGFKPSN